VTKEEIREEEGHWCYVTGFGYTCSTCQERARCEEKLETEETGEMRTPKE